jgi:hypothetical protein
VGCSANLPRAVLASCCPPPPPPPLLRPTIEFTHTAAPIHSDLSAHLPLCLSAHTRIPRAHLNYSAFPNSPRLLSRAASRPCAGGRRRRKSRILQEVRLRQEVSAPVSHRNRRRKRRTASGAKHR